MIKLIISFVGGAIVGAAGGALYFKRHYKKWADKEIASYKETYKKNWDSVKELKKELGDAVEEINKQATEAADERLRKLNVAEDGKGVGHTDYSKMYFEATFEHPKDDDEEPLTDEEEAELAEGLAINKAREMAKSRPPKIILPEVYGQDPIYEDLHLDFYFKDKVVADENREMVDNWKELLGNCLFETGFADNNEKRLFVRNYQLTMDIEVTKIYEAYSDVT